MAQTLDDLSYTWNNAGTTFTGIKYNVTDTASAANSLLMDLRVGGVSKFKVDKSGIVYTLGSPYINVTDAAPPGTTGIYTYANHLVLTSRSNTGQASVSSFGFKVGSTYGIGWASNNADNAHDLALYRDGANTLAQRNSTNAQTKRLYGTYTDGSNYRRLTQTMSTAGVAEIKPEGAGTGASGNVLHISGLPTSNPGAGILWNDNGTVKVGT